MLRIFLVSSLVPFVTTAAQAQDKPALPVGLPPRIVSILRVEGDLVVYRDFLYVALMPKVPGRLRPGELAPALAAAGPAIPCAVEFPLKEGEVYDAEGNRLEVQEARKRLAAGSLVLVSASGKKVDPAYLRIIDKAALILVPPLPPPGPRPPGGGE